MNWTDIAFFYLLPLFTVVTLWLGLTFGLIWLNRRGQRVAGWAVFLSVPLLVLAHSELIVTRHDLSAFGAYRAFTAGLFVWAWHELAFYSGLLAGPRRKPCPPDARGVQRFLYALGTHFYHQLAFVFEMGLLIWLLQDASHWLGPLTFGLSWALQQSAKLNVLYGVRALQVELFPAHLAFLASYWRPGPPSAFFRPSVSVCTLLAIMLWFSIGAHLGDPAAIRLALLASLLTLGALEHWLLLLPAPAPATAPATD
ncbi:putative photosynthetic complex assembly protein PuhE [Chloroflexus sp.]|uniref:putative photosynthetic complex assembly protein PuhE n=1 Tax=Chloroflexus sp. TaxID=1904827 RepID=UPI002ACE272E|nr:putative photosynthetic complex assembly protein PuhE [Chloroflexus sp.]